MNEANIRLLAKSDAKRLLKKAHPQTQGKKILLYVGALLEEKNIPLVLQALDLMKRPNLMFVVVGDGPFMPEIHRRCAGRTDVLLTGRIVEEVGPYFDAADCFVLPGTGGLAINEAMAHSLPIVSGYGDGSADDLLQHGKNGYRLYDNTASEIARRVNNIITDHKKGRAFGAVSRKLITGKFSFDRFLSRVCQGIDKAISDG
jgi:glycosyltransferase involved in cell wall biosynthesis